MKNNNAKTRIIVGMSGGVDSAVAALLLKNQGYDVHGVFMHNWQADEDDPYCTHNQDAQDAKTVCEQLEIPFSTVSFAKEYFQQVFQKFLDEYSAGRTPNPDVLCNKEIKFNAFLKYALEQKADFIATGHYVRKKEESCKQFLLKGIDPEKDQSYFLYSINQKQLCHSLFPIGELTKPEVRAIAKKHGLVNFSKKDSTGICFIGERRFKEFLKEYLLTKPGTILNIDTGNQIGHHDGLMFYTLGQRKGLKIGGQKNAKEKPWYVVKKDLSNNQLFVSQQHNHQLLLSNRLVFDSASWINEIEPQLPLVCNAKIRYRMPDQKCEIIKKEETKYLVKFNESQWAITPGQAVVFYHDDICLGGGTIC